jgi:hypothetical protein
LVILPSAVMLQDATWSSLLDFVRGGGALLITGSAERNEDWQPRRRLAELGLNASPHALIYREIDMHLGGKTVVSTFSNINQRAVEMLRIPGGSNFAEMIYGKGRIFIAAPPVELAESPRSAEEVYEYVLSQLGISSPFEATGASPSILIRPRIFPDAILYLLVSEDADAHDLAIRDKRSGREFKVHLEPGRSKMVMLDKASGITLSTYDGPSL